MHFICIYLLALLHIFEYTKKTELYPAIGKEELFQMLYSKNKKRGFTLVELIVVLVILAILAALLIPALTGYIDKAKKDQVIAETRMLHEAVQTEMSEIYGSSINWKENPLTTIANDTGSVVSGSTMIGSSQDLKDRYTAIMKLSELPDSSKFLAIINGSGKVYALIYRSNRGYLGLYFSDTQQYIAYKLGDTTDYGTVNDDAYSYYYSSVYYNTAVDETLNPNDKNFTAIYPWSCPGLRYMLNIGAYEY